MHEHGPASSLTVPFSSHASRRTHASPHRQRWPLVGLLGYLSLPFDLIPDFIPVLGALDDAILVALVLRMGLRPAGAEIVREHWPGPQRSLELVLRLALGTRT